MDEETLNKSVRAFLKKVGINSQREIERAVREKADAGTLPSASQVSAHIVLRVPDLDVELEISDDIEIGQ